MYAEPDSATMALLRRVEGLDFEFGLRNLRGDVGRYRRLLDEFAARHGVDMVEVGASLAAGDAETAIRIAHTLKGSAGTLGLTRLQAAAKDLEMALRRGEPEVGALAAAVGRLQAALAAALAAVPPQECASAGADADQAQRILRQLEQLLLASEFKANKLFEANAALLRASLEAATMNRLERAMKDFDFPAALAAVAAALDSMARSA